MPSRERENGRKACYKDFFGRDFPLARRIQAAAADTPSAAPYFSGAPLVVLVADALLDCSARDALVLLDAFLGSESTLIAAERAGYSCYGIELDALYVDTAIKCWQRNTGDHAVHAK